MNKRIGLVLIHGAGLNASIWDDLITEIRVPVLAIDLPNRKKGDKANEKLTFEDYADSAVSQINNWDQEHFVIAAHSIGACVGLKISNHFENRLKGFVAISSVIPLSGKSFVSALPVPQKFILPLILRLLGTKPPQKSIENDLCNDLSAGQTQKIVEEFTPEAASLYTSHISYSLPDAARLYIKLTQDKSMPVDLQDRMAKNLKANKVLTIDSGHLPMLSKAGQLAAFLTGFIRDAAMAWKTDQN